jgi:hypothetical protein
MSSLLQFHQWHMSSPVTKAAYRDVIRAWFGPVMWSWTFARELGSSVIGLASLPLSGFSPRTLE